MRVLQLTDMHIYATPEARFEGVDTRASCAQVLAHVHAHVRAYQALVLSGDLAMDGSAAAYAWLAHTFAVEHVPLLALPGNHDEPTVMARAAPALLRPMPATLQLGPWCLIGLDTRIAQRPQGALHAAQLAWLAALVARCPAPHVGIFMHHPPLAIDSPWLDPMGLRDATALWQLCESWSALRFIACGHVHQNLDTWRGTVRVLVTPSTCVQFAPRARGYQIDPRAPGYRILDLHDDGRVTTEVVRIAL